MKTPTACTITSHDRLKSNAAAWLTLPYGGVLDMHGTTWLELRQCVCCGSTLAVEVALVEGAVVVEGQE